MTSLLFLLKFSNWNVNVHQCNGSFKHQHTPVDEITKTGTRTGIWNWRRILHETYEAVSKFGNVKEIWMFIRVFQTILGKRPLVHRQVLKYLTLPWVYLFVSIINMMKCDFLWTLLTMHTGCIFCWLDLNQYFSIVWLFDWSEIIPFFVFCSCLCDEFNS